MVTKLSSLTGREKAAILLISLGADVAAQVFKALNENEIEELTLEIANVRRVEQDVKDEVLEQFYQIVMAQNYISQGGIGYAKQILEKALGKNSASEIINRLTSSLQVKPFDFLRKSDAQQILNFLQHEHPQTIALVMAYLEPAQAGQVLSSLPQELQTEVARRIATMDRTSPEIINEVELILEKKFSTTVSQDYTKAGGIEAVVNVLNGVDRATEKTILDALNIQAPELSEEIKKRMFVFEDIVGLDNRAIQRIIREVDNEDLLLSLKTASEEVKGIIFQNMSQRRVESFKEEMEFMGPVRLKDVEEAQSKIVSTIRRLEDTGEVVIARGGGDDIIV
ncbi:flagellar motor switch protein FliG [Pullulanibacillus pueri]|uniref:Flagellar motor switch protein FliG n=1 Tax=Pullulanibacillus pueri TaxID=1437324 RepID=A0A8J3EM62_9BACL|nr:flagellar motor switch protein FliG [Pullulanibacillus pueri]MBM7682475.1 flagellar motor switch protein FliG [Pullulanibacillus pueri]GGH82250.1 flagellar motor switch protein FliG [Pullulanibacillus pueri]